MNTKCTEGMSEALISLTLSQLVAPRWIIVQFSSASFIKHSISELFRNGESGVKLRYCSSYVYQPSCVTVIPLLFKQKKKELKAVSLY